MNLIVNHHVDHELSFNFLPFSLLYMKENSPHFDPGNARVMMVSTDKPLIQQLISAYETILNPLASAAERKTSEAVSSQRCKGNLFHSFFLFSFAMV